MGHRDCKDLYDNIKELKKSPSTCSKSSKCTSTSPPVLQLPLPTSPAETLVILSIVVEHEYLDKNIF